MCTTKVSPTLATMSPLASISMPELSMATCPRGSLSTAKTSPADAATARCTSSRSAMRPLSRTLSLLAIQLRGIHVGTADDDGDALAGRGLIGAGEQRRDADRGG